MGFIIVQLVSLLILVPNLAVEVRRFHDMDNTGWWVLISFIPILGALAVLLWFTARGTDGENRFGPDPLGPPFPPGSVRERLHEEQRP
jgi:uncharacterized membrane protein YhaH (DUF805 family)